MIKVIGNATIEFRFPAVVCLEFIQAIIILRRNPWLSWEHLYNGIVENDHCEFKPEQR